MEWPFMDKSLVLQYKKKWNKNNFHFTFSHTEMRASKILVWSGKSEMKMIFISLFLIL